MADKVKKNQFTLLLEKLGCDLKFISDILIMILRMNGLRKTIFVLKKYLCWHYSFLNY